MAHKLAVIHDIWVATLVSQVLLLKCIAFEIDRISCGLIAKWEHRVCGDEAASVRALHYSKTPHQASASVTYRMSPTGIHVKQYWNKNT